MLKSFLHHPQRVRWRQIVFQVHLWVGVIVGLYMLAISISGSVLVFQRELTSDAPTLRTEPARSNGLTYGQIVDELQRGKPALVLQSIDLRSSERRVVTLTFRANGRERVYCVDREGGQVVGDADLQRRHPVMVWLEKLHNELLGGSAGATANGFGALLLVLLCITGLVIWWPGRRVWPRAVTVKWQAGWRRINFDLHSAVGFWTVVILLMWGLTGAYFIFPGVIQKPLHLFSTPAGAKRSHWTSGARLLSIDAYVSRAEKEFPGEDLAYLYMDVFRPEGQVAVFLSTDPAIPLTLREDIVHLDPGTAEVLWTESSKKWSPAERILMGSYSVHFGDFGGIVSKCIWCVLSIALSILTLTGYLMWWNRVLRKKWQSYRRLASEGHRAGTARIPHVN